MDHLLYIAMSGAKENMNGMALRSNNLANASTTGFKADFEQARSMQAFGEGLPTRVFSLTERPGQNFDAGAIIMTERELDVAIQGDGWLAVQAQRQFADQRPWYAGNRNRAAGIGRRWPYPVTGTVG